jgi:hypothetical protein
MLDLEVVDFAGSASESCISHFTCCTYSSNCGEMNVHVEGSR